VSRPADRLHTENAKVKRSALSQLRDIIKRLEDPSVELRDFYGSVEHGTVILTDPEKDTFQRHGYNGTSEFSFTIRLYNPHKDALLCLDADQPTDLTGD
jgi:hypothetical protein